MLEWDQKDNGNYLCHGDHGVATVFRKESGGWSGVHDGYFLKATCDDAEKAMNLMERYLLEGETDLVRRPVTGWQTSKAGGYYRRTMNGTVSVKKAKTGKWYLVIPDIGMLKDRWFDSAESAMQDGDQRLSL